MLFLNVLPGAKDTAILKRKLEPVAWPPAEILYSISPSFNYVVSANLQQYINSHVNQDLLQIHFIQDIRYGILADKPGKLKFNQEIQSNIGVFCIIDSTYQVRPDENHWKANLSVNITRFFTFLLDSDFSTALFNRYDLMPDTSGKLQKVLDASFCTPLVWNISAGFQYATIDWFRFSVGITSGKLTGMLNNRVYTEKNTHLLWGVEQGRKYHFEYGLSFRMTVDRTFSEKHKWYVDVHLFKNYQKAMDLNAENKILLNVGKNVCITLKTRIIYEKENSRKVQWENLLSFGFTYAF
ncbi:MAG: hypothetical protein FJY10_02555 [Bacteroidetes bacterium]|nr:hypothetical protein [Bacteroidota bacterium]